MIGAFKAAVTRTVNQDRGTPGKDVWQSSFYESLVRRPGSIERIRHYIELNPSRWTKK